MVEPEPEASSAMPEVITEKQGYLRAQFQKIPYDQVWHVWTATIPRISITGQLVWGTVMRRRDGGRWIYKKYIENKDSTVEFFANAALKRRAPSKNGI
jgi:hypothetical protein